MHQSRQGLTSRLRLRGQTTVPEPVRRALKVTAGDLLLYQISDDGVVISGLGLAQIDRARGLDAVLVEWNGPQDDGL